MNNASIPVQSTAIATATVNPANAGDKTVTWSSSNIAVATVSASGVVTAVAPGTANIIATSVAAPTVSGSATVTVTAILPTAISVQAPTSMTVGNTATATATVTPANATNSSVTWTSSNDAIATVTPNGVITAVAAGTVTITATSVSAPTVSGTATIVISNNVVVPTAITIIPATAVSVEPGQTVVLSLSFTPANTTEQAVTWVSSDNAIATVSASGVVTGVAPGIVTITVTSSSAPTVSTTKQVTVTAILPTAITILPSTPISISVGETTTLTAEITPASATNKNVTWTTSNTAIATVSASGVVTGVSEGTVTITATSVSAPAVSSTKQIQINAVLPSAITVTLSPNSLSVGGTSTASADVSPANAGNKSVTWTSSNVNVATVNANGVVTAIGQGTATITATSVAAPTVTGSASLTVSSVLPSSITVTLTSSVLSVGGSTTATATVNPSNAGDKSVTWTSSNTSVATINANGQITAIGAGTAIITATSVAAPAINGTATITVNTVLPTGITVTITPNSLAVGGTATATAEVLPSNAGDKSVTWTSSNTAIATVNASGVVTAVAPGTALITATSVAAGGVSGTASITVSSIVPTSIVVTLSPVSISIGATSQATATVSPANAGDKSVTWTSSNTAVASVNANGVVTAIASGTAIITATSVAAPTVSGSATITVSNVAVTSIVANPTSAIIEIGQTRTIAITVEPSNATVKTVTFASSNSNIASVNPNGVVTAVTKGSAIITITSTANPNVSTAVIIECVSKSALYSAINSAQSIHNAALEGTANGYYPVGSKATLQSAINAANDVYTSASSTQAQIDQAQANLQNAVSTFQQSVIVVNKAELSNLITQAQTTHNLAIEGTAVGQYPSGSKATLQSAINAAITVNNNTIASQADVNAAKATLQSALDAFTNSVNVLGPVDKSQLQASINQAQTLYTNSTEGLAEGQYPSGSKNILMNAISTANAVNNNASATQTQVNTANTNLQTAIAEFQAKVVHVDKTALVNQIASAQAVYNVSQEGTLNGQYPVGSKANLMQAITVAQGVNTNTLATQTQVDQAETSLLNALNTFLSLQINIVLDKAPLQSKISQATSSLAKADNNTGSNPGQYPQAAVNDLLIARAAAENVLATATTQNQLNSAEITLQAAIIEFENSVNPIVVDKSELEALIAEADVLFETTVIGTNPGEYGQLEYFNLYNVTNSSRVALNDNTKTQNQINDQVALLEAAITAYKDSMTPTSIDVVNNVTVQAWPNPCTEQIHIAASADIVSVELVSVAGKTQFVAPSVHADKATIDVSKLANGLYVITVELIDGSTKTMQVVKQ
ncbi:MAG: Gellan lyase precursor [Bacteroidetes bacterium ADurb.Bin217]|nr:MAG: Gellan lyase precursor [Bacteroidetes bacterium ADurb.Bin217]